METFTQATETFLAAADDWLTDEDSPAVASLRIMAAELDSNFVTATVAQYNLTYRHLLKKAAGDMQEVDPLEALLS